MPSNNKGSVNPLETEVKLLKESLVQEQQRRDIFFSDMMKQYQEMNNIMHSNENQMLQRLKNHKDEIIEEHRYAKEQQKRLEE